MARTCALGVLLFDMPHSALNNAGKSLESSVENAIAVKTIQKGREAYPYISAQAWRYWWRNTLEEKAGWHMSPIERDKKIAFTQADPMKYPDDDVFGYMRAESTKKDGANKKEKGEEKAFTRLSPLKCSPLVSVTPSRTVADFGVMARHEGDPVPYESQFYSTVMKGSFSLDLSAVGSYLSLKRAGYQNIGETKKKEYLAAGAVERNGFIEIDSETRAKRASDAIDALAYLAGGAKQTIYLTDVVPKFGLFVIFKGGNHPFMSVIYNKDKEVFIDIEALKVVMKEYGECVKSKIYIGKAPGFMNELDEDLRRLDNDNNEFEYNTFKKTIEKFTNSVSLFYR